MGWGNEGGGDQIVGGAALILSIDLKNWHTCNKY